MRGSGPADPIKKGRGDVINGGPGDNVIDASGLTAGAITLTLAGGNGSDVLVGSQGNDTLSSVPSAMTCCSEAPGLTTCSEDPAKTHFCSRVPALRPSISGSVRAEM